MRLSERLFEGGLLLPSDRGVQDVRFFPSSPSMIPDRFVSRFFPLSFAGCGGAY